MAKAGESAEYRAIVRFSANSGKQAKTMADAAVKALGPTAKLDRITTRRETWGSVPEDEE